MGYIKPRVKYTTISISEDLMNEIKKYLSINSSYTSIADFVREAVRDKMKNDIGKEKLKHLISEEELDYKIREVFDNIVNEKIAKQKKKPTIIKK